MNDETSRILTSARIRQAYQRELSELLSNLDVPKMRVDIKNPQNLRWLNRNLMVNNSTNSHAARAKDLIKQLLRSL